MKGVAKYILFFFLVVCASEKEVVEKRDLKQDFENIWWEVVDNPLAISPEEKTCLYFNSEADVKSPADGEVVYHIKGEELSYILSRFERIQDGYYLFYYDVDVIMFVDEFGNYSAKIKSNTFLRTVDIIPCSFM